jgi:hypothetical protein
MQCPLGGHVHRSCHLGGLSGVPLAAFVGVRRHHDSGIGTDRQLDEQVLQVCKVQPVDWSFGNNQAGDGAPVSWLPEKGLGAVASRSPSSTHRCLAARTMPDLPMIA